MLACLSRTLSPSLALVLGIMVAQFIGHPYLHLNHRATHFLLQVSVVGLGFGMNVHRAAEAGKDGILFTIASILGTLVLGYLLGKLFKLERTTSFLISIGTAICGGSAIAAVSPVIKAKEGHISVALGTVFILNSLALFIFPFIGHLLDLSQNQFGLWSAIAIHDTSSVVGAASRFGGDALEIATTVKLTRALWIIPVALGSAVIFKTGKGKIKVPYFIGLFVLAMVLNTYLPGMESFGHHIVDLSKSGLTLTLFLIGSGLSGSVLKSVGYRPLLQGVVLWVVISTTALWAIVMLGG
nr:MULTISPECIES: putative sulfate exporter family transporter [unclassified Allomuricauda]